MPTPAEQHFGRRIPGWLVLMGFLTALGPIAIDMYLPAFPAMADNLNTTPAHIERTLAGYLFGLALAQLVYGPIADRFGRRLPLFTGLLIFLIASIGCAYSNSIEQLSMWRMAQAFGGAVTMVVPRAVISDRLATNDAAKALSMLMLIMGVTPILAPLIGGQFLIFFDWHVIFIFMALYAALMLAISWRNMDETLAPHRRQALKPHIIARNYALLSTHRGFMLYSLAGALGSAGMFAYISGSPRVIIQIFAIQPSFFGFLFGVSATSFISLSQVNARLLNRFQLAQLLRVAQITQSIVAVIGISLSLLGLMTLPIFMLLIVFFMGCLGFINPNATALALSRHNRRLGSASALLGTMQMLAGALSGLAISAWSSPTTVPLTSIFLFCALASWACGRLAASSKT